MKSLSKRTWSRLTAMDVVGYIVFVLIVCGLFVFAAPVSLTDVAVFVVVTLLIVAGMFLELYRRMQHQFNEQWNHYYQIEALFSLHRFITPRVPLPPTRRWAASPDFLNKLVTHVLNHKPVTIVDLGSGVTTIVAGYLLEAYGGKVVGVDHDAAYVNQTQELISQHGLASNCCVIHAPLKPQEMNGTTRIWYDLEVLRERIKQIDLLIVDGPPQRTQKHARYPAVDVLFSNLSSGAAVLIDDTQSPEIAETVAKWRQQYPSLKARELTAEKGAMLLIKQ